MAQPPVRVLILLDGDNVAPEKSYLTARAQGGSLSAYQIAEQARRWISNELGRDASISCLLFADVAHLSRSMDLSSEGTLAFSKGFSSTPSPCAFVHVLQGTTLAAISAHLAFLLPTIDYLFLGGFSTGIHAYHISKTLKSSTTSVPKIVLLSTSQTPVVQSMSNLAHSTTRFSGISEVVHQRVETILTNPHHEFSDGYQASSPTASSIASPVVATRLPASRLHAFPGSEEDTNPWLNSEPLPRAQASAPPRRQSVQMQSPAPYPPGLILPTGMVQPAPSSETVESVRDPTRTSPILSQLLTTTASPPPSTPQPQPPSRSSSTPIAVQQAPIGTPSPSSTSKPASSPSVTSLSPSTSFIPVEAAPQPRAPTVPSRFLPLLRLIHSHSTETPIAPLWSTIGSELPKTSYPKGVKFKEFLMEAQKEGWVVTGKGEGEGREWVKISKRGERALAKSG